MVTTCVRGQRRRGRWRTLAIVLTALLTAVVGIGSQVALVDNLTSDANSPVYPRPSQKPEVLLNAHDGKFFAAIAEDPLLRHPQTIGPEVAQRASRPLLSWLVAIASLGNRRVIPWMLMLFTALSLAALVASVALLADALDRDGRHPSSLAVLAVPGALALVLYPGLSDALGAALAVAGIAAWKRDRDGLALLLFVAATLTHEALFAFPFAVFVHTAAQRNRSAFVWLSAALPYLCWVVFVRVRVDAWPTASSHGNLAWPFSGLWSAVQDRWQPLDAVCVLALVAAGVLVWFRLREVVFRVLVAAFAAIAIVLGPFIWARWVDFGRVLLPLSALAVVALAPELSARSASARTSPGRAASCS